jgi:hypothetical protein
VEGRVSSGGGEVVLLWVTASAAALGFALPFEREEGVEGARHARLRPPGVGERRRRRRLERKENQKSLGFWGKTGEARLSIRDGRMRCVR